MIDSHRINPEPGAPKMTELASAIQQAYPKSVSAEVTELLKNFADLPPFSQQVAMKVLRNIPPYAAANDAEFTRAA